MYVRADIIMCAYSYILYMAITHESAYLVSIIYCTVSFAFTNHVYYNYVLKYLKLNC